MLIGASLRALKTLMDTHPAKLTIASKTIQGAAIEQRGMMEDARGSFIQGRKVRGVCDFKQLASSDLMDATTGVVKRQTLTVEAFGTSQSYRVMRANFDPMRVMWSIEAEQTVT